MIRPASPDDLPMTITKNKKPGLAIVISSPSGTGKTTICRRLVRKHRDYRFSISATTRSPRGKERHGYDYYFYSKKDFLKAKRTGRLFETTNYLGNLYGTPKKPLLKAISQGRVILLDIDIPGGLAVKKQLPEAVTIFLVPPNMKELRRRLTMRRTETAAALKARLKSAAGELKRWNRYDYVVVNDDLKTAVRQVEAIIEAERLKSKRKGDSRYWNRKLALMLGLAE